MERLSEFVLEKVLQTKPEAKETVLLGAIGTDKCIVKLRRLALPEVPVGSHLPLQSTSILDTNDVYSWGTGVLTESGTVYLDVVCPASDTHIAKYTECPKRMVTEGPQQYSSKVKPYIETQRGQQIDWVRGILHNGVEADRVLFRDPDFVLLPNSKWDRKTVGSLYLLALAGPARAHLASIRDLTAQDIPLLEHIRDTSAQLVQEQWGLHPSQIKMYFHYHPSYYHLHVHITNVELQDIDDFGRCVLLQQVIDMLKLQPMEEASLTYVMRENHQVYKALTGL